MRSNEESNSHICLIFIISLRKRKLKILFSIIYDLKPILKVLSHIDVFRLC